MSTHRASVRYAKSLLLLAQEQKVVEQVKEDMQFFSKVLVENRSLAVMLKNPIIHASQKKAVLTALFGKRVQKLTMSAFNLIVAKNRENILDEIAIEFVKEYHVLKGIAMATVETPYKLDAKQKKEMEQLVMNITGKKAELEEKIDESLIGGFVLNIGDQQIDESVKNKLAKIQRALVA